MLMIIKTVRASHKLSWHELTQVFRQSYKSTTNSLGSIKLTNIFGPM